jgi:GNAT superfamily N-acetyltransferase
MEITVRRNTLNPTETDMILRLKDSEWAHGYESQLEWFQKNVGEHDTHCLAIHADRLLAYGVLREVSNTHHILDTIIAHADHRGRGLGTRVVNALLSTATKPVFLLCKVIHVPFYEKAGFRTNREVTFIDKDTGGLETMSAEYGDVASSVPQRLLYYRKNLEQKQPAGALDPSHHTR